MRTFTEYEPQDIDLGDSKTGSQGNPVHVFLMGQVMLAALTGFSKDPKHLDDPLWPLRVSVAQALNMMEKEGWELVRKEGVPAAFRDAIG